MLYKSKNPHGGDIYCGGIRLDFSANTNPMGTPERVVEAAALSLKHADRYPDPYARELVDAIAEYHGLPKEYILAGAGAAELIYSYCLAGSFRTALTAAPTFQEYGLALESTGTEVSCFYLDEEADFRLDDGIVDMIRETRPDAVFICNPNNPSGKLADPGLLHDILHASDELGIRMFLDECFVELAEGESLIGELKNHRGLTILRAFTKNYGMAGLRLGYVLSSDSELLSAMSGKVQPWNLSTPAQAAGVQALKEKEFLKTSIELIKEEREYLAGGLRDLGLRVIGSDVNFLLFKGPEDLCEKLRERGILLRNCDNFKGLGPGWYRIAVKLRDENEVLLKEIGNALGD